MAQRGGRSKPQVQLRPKGFARLTSAVHGIHKITHAIVIIKENRAFDNYFSPFLGADGATSGTIPTGGVVPLGHTDRMPRDISRPLQPA